VSRCHDPQYLAQIFEAELAAVLAHHIELARLERECTLLERRRRAHVVDDEDEE
jgi:hypothetical protein